MKRFTLLVLLMIARLGFAQSLPVITSSPTNQIVTPGSTATFSVSATGATEYQWRCNGVDISGGTNATLQVVNAQTNNSGYYLALAKNVAGWRPSQMAWLSVVGSNGIVPLSNVAAGTAGRANNLYTPIYYGTARVWAGPQLD
jgi:hypothetical protein